MKKTIIVLLIVLIASCQTKFNGNPEKLKLSDLKQSLEDSKGAVRIALSEIQKDELPEKSYSELLNLGKINRTTTHYDFSLPKRILDAFNLNHSAKTMELKDKTLRLDKIKITGNLKPITIKTPYKNLNIPFILNSNSEIEVIRTFRDSYDAKRAYPFNITDLPLDAKRARKLPKGTYISIPIEASVVSQVNGRFLTSSFSYAKEIRNLLKTSVTGITSGIAQAALIARGKFRLQIVKLDEDRVRVRVLEEKKFKVHGGASFAAGGRLRYLLVPFSKIDRAINIKDKILNRVLYPERRIVDIENRIRDKRLSLKNKFDDFNNFADSIPEPFNNGKEARDIAKRVVDDAITIAEDSEKSVSDLRKLVFSGVNEAVNRINSYYEDKVYPVTDRIKKYTDRTFNLKMSVDLRANFSKRHRFIADYVFDLKNSEAAMAYTHSVSGRAKWLGRSPGLNLANGSLIDFTVAEKIASEDETSSTKRVLRELVAKSDSKKADLHITFKGPFALTGFKERWEENRAYAKVSTGESLGFYTWLWSFDKNVRVPNMSTSSRISTGFIVPTDEYFSGKRLGSFFVRLKNHTKNHNPYYMEKTFNEALNLLGPVGLNSGLASLYKGEFPGDKSLDLSISYKKEAVKRLFDKNVTTDEILWRALENTALGFNNEFGLPYNVFGMVPPEVERNYISSKACTVVSQKWGRSYCASFATKFMESLKEARDSSDPIKKMKVFEYFYRKNFLANKIGPRLFIRYLSEVSHLTRGSKAHEDFSIDFNIINFSNESEYASPSLELGMDKEMDILNAIGVNL